MSPRARALGSLAASAALVLLLVACSDEPSGPPAAGEVGGPPPQAVQRRTPGQEAREAQAALAGRTALTAEVHLLHAHGCTNCHDGGPAALPARGLVEWRHLWLAVALLPGVLAGVAFSLPLARYVDGGTLKPWALGLSSLAAIGLLIKSLV